MNRLEATVASRDELSADLQSPRARAFPVGIRVVVRFPPDSPRILALPPR